jgi:hypothetical protein
MFRCELHCRARSHVLLRRARINIAPLCAQVIAIQPGVGPCCRAVLPVRDGGNGFVRGRWPCVLTTVNGNVRIRGVDALYHLWLTYQCYV